MRAKFRKAGSCILYFPRGTFRGAGTVQGTCRSRCAVDAGTSMSPYLTLPVECQPTALLWKCLASPGPPYSYYGSVMKIVVVPTKLSKGGSVFESFRGLAPWPPQNLEVPPKTKLLPCPKHVQLQPLPPRARRHYSRNQGPRTRCTKVLSHILFQATFFFPLGARQPPKSP